MTKEEALEKLISMVYRDYSYGVNYVASQMHYYDGVCGINDMSITFELLPKAIDVVRADLKGGVYND